MEKKPQDQTNSVSTRTEKDIEKDIKVDVTARMQNLFGENELKSKALPMTTAEAPYKIFAERGKILILSAPMVGSLTATDDKADILRNSLRLAESMKAELVFVDGNLMYMLTQRYGSQRAYKTQVSGVRIDPKKVQDAYPKAVVKADKFQSIEDRLQKGEPVFMTLRLRLDHTTDMLNEMFTDTKGRPLYNGPVCIAFGRLEDELIMHYANELLRVGLFKTRAWALKNYNERKSLFRSCKDEVKKKAIYQEMREFKEFLDVWAIMGNMIDESVESARLLVAAYIVRKYEERIPNAKVISVGDAYLKVGSNLIMATTNKGSGQSNGRLSAMLAAKTESYSKGRMTTNIPNVMLGAGLNPCFDMKFVTYQASDEPGDKRMCMIVQLPMCIDSERYREVVRGQNILKDAITRVVQTSGFESGVVMLQWHDCLSLPVVSLWTSDVLKNKHIFKDSDGIKDLLKAKKKENKLIYSHKEGCTHYGANDIILYDSPNDPNNRLVKYHQQVTKEFLLACDAPILSHQHDGDITQQMNHDYQKNVHLEYLLPEELQKKIMEIEKDPKLSMADKLKAVMKLAMEQKVRDGIYDFEKQIDGYVQSLEPYLKYIIQVLRRSKKANLTFEGLFSVIVHIAGNHNKNTFKHVPFYVSDAKYITVALKVLLLVYIIKKLQLDLVDDIVKEVTSPGNGPLGEARGALCVDGKKCYAMLLKHKQGPMPKTQTRGSRRGQEYFEVGLPICNLSGDDHKGGVRVNRGIVHIKTGCQQGEGSFGREIDFSEQNVFSMVFGVPVGGFSNGPLVFMVLDYATMRRYAIKPFPISRESLFKNALE